MLAVQDVIAAIGGVLDAITQAILAMSFGFQMLPTALAYVVGIGGCLAYKSVLPISLQAETITMAGTMGKNIRERLSMVIYAGIITATFGAFGLLQNIVDFAGDNIVCAMMAGVGIILTRVSIDMAKDNKLVGLVSMVVGLGVYVFTQDLVYTTVISVIVSSAAWLIKNGKPQEEVTTEERFKLKFYKPTINLGVIRGALALMCLTVGANIAFGGITADMAGVQANVDGLSVYSGLADLVSALFGGVSLEAIISTTAAAPHPLTAAILMMAAMAIILATGLLPKIAKFVPAESITGFLFVLGALVTIPVNSFFAFDGADTVGALSAGITLAVTAISDPFIGMVAGIAMKLIAPILGLTF